MPIGHNFVAPVIDAGDPNEVGPDEWNDEHTLPDALEIPFDNTNFGNLTAANLQEAIDELLQGRAVVDHGSMGATETFDYSVSPGHQGLLTANLTVTLAGAVGGREAFMTIKLKQDSTAGWEVTWPAEVLWPGGVAPTIDPAIDAYTIVALFSYDAGVTWFGAYPGASTGGGGGGDTLLVEEEDGTAVSGTTTLRFEDAHFSVDEVASGVAKVSLATSPGAGFNSMPLTAVIDGEPVLLWDENNNLIGGA